MDNNMLSKIADSELQVMRVLWREKKALSVAQIRDALAQTGWDGSTIKTLVYRLADKGALAVDKQSPALYSPNVSEQEYSRYATSVFIDKLYGGKAKNLIAALVNAKSLNDDDIAELSAMFKMGD